MMRSTRDQLTRRTRYNDCARLLEEDNYRLVNAVGLVEYSLRYSSTSASQAVADAQTGTLLQGR